MDCNERCTEEESETSAVGVEKGRTVISGEENFGEAFLANSKTLNIAGTDEDIYEKFGEPSIYGAVDTTYVNAWGEEVAPGENVSKKVRPDNEAAASLPSSYDMRAQNRLTPIRSQGQYGTCWAHSMMSSAESQMITRGKGTFDYSEDHLVWFHGRKNTEQGDGINLTTDKSSKTSMYNCGGNYIESVGTLSSWTGVATEALFPYGTGNYPESKRYTSSLHLQDAEVIANTFQQTKQYADEIKQSVVDNGSVVVSYYDDDSGYGTTGTTKYSYYQNNITDSSKDSSNHSVSIVGWDDNYARTNFNSAMRPTKNGAWLIRNSWGANFGDKGYMWISYEEPTLQKAVACNFESVDNYDNIYLHDGVGPNQQYAYLFSSGVKEVSMANKFCSKSNETLKAVSFWTSNYNIGYTINIYSSTSSPTEVSTKLLSSCSGNIINMGYHTIDLSSPVSLNSGDWFTVMVKLKVNNSDSSVRFQFEGNNRTDTFGNYEFTCTQGESFINFNDGEGWYDAKYVTFWGDCYNNACIRAFTVDRGASPTPTLTITPSTLSLNTTTNKTASVNVHTTGGNYVTSSMSQEGIIDCDIGTWEGDDFNVTVTALKAGTCTYTLNLKQQRYCNCSRSRCRHN